MKLVFALTEKFISLALVGFIFEIIIGLVSLAIIIWFIFKLIDMLT